LCTCTRFFIRSTAPTSLSTLSLHDALPIFVCARERHLGPDIRPGVLYTSDQAHYSVAKAAKLAGIMPDRVRSVPSDGQYRLRTEDRKSTRLNSSHSQISYAVFCLTKQSLLL